MKLRKYKALLIKDLKLTYMNKSIVLLLLLPVMFSFVYASISKGSDTNSTSTTLLSMITQLGLMVIGSSVMAMAIAEEKEKKTLRTLMLSDVSAIEFLVSKLLVMLFLFITVMLICFYIIKADVNILPEYIVMLVLTTVSLLFLSSIVGMLAQSQQSAGVISTPIMFLSAIPMFSTMGTSQTFLTISKFMPTGPILFMLDGFSEVPIDYSSLLGYGSMIAWIIISLIGFSYFYKLKSIDN